MDKVKPIILESWKSGEFQKKTQNGDQSTLTTAL